MFVSVQEKLDKLVALTPDDQEKLSHYKSIVPAMIANCHKAHQSIPGWESCKPEIEAFKWFDGINIPVHGYIDLKGDKVIMWYISGNRDEAIFPDADRLVVDRKNARNHLAFGFGIHRCMGNRLAEMQLRILWEEILKRFSFVEVAGTPVRLPNNFIRGIKEVPVILHPL